MDSWKDELENMNRGKEGREGGSCTQTHTYIEFLSFVKVGFDIPYRTVQGIQGAEVQRCWG